MKGTMTAWTLVLAGLRMHSAVATNPRTSFVDVTQDPQIFPPGGYEYPPDPEYIKSWLELISNFSEVPPAFVDPFFYADKWSGNGYGNVGVAIFDFDGDGDADIYVANSEFSANSLFKNLLVETGSLKFVDVANQFGVDAVDLDASGVCVADVDNDGDLDFVVLSNRKKPRLFLNQLDQGPNAPFVMVNSFFRTVPPGQRQEACSFGDVNGDGYHDLYIVINPGTRSFGPCYDPSLWSALTDEMWINDGTGTNFVDETGPRGLLAGGGLMTWGVAVVDIDQDGDMDILTANDMCAVPGVALALGLSVVLEAASKLSLRVWINDGTGHFEERSNALGTNTSNVFEAWMGFAVGDLNSDGLLDFFATNMGDVAHFAFRLANTFGMEARSRPFIQQPDGTFADSWPAFGSDFIGTEFGFGCGMADFDANGTTDIVYLGGLSGSTTLFTFNPGVVLRNDGLGNFRFDSGLATSGRKYQDRGIKGVAVGDLNQDGFPDVVAVGAFTAVEPNGPNIGLTQLSFPEYLSFSPIANETDLNPFNFDPVLGTRSFSRTTFNPALGRLSVTYDDPPDLFVGNQLNRNRIDFGKLSIEINQNGLYSTNRWVGVKTVGTVPGTPVDGIGSTIRVWKCDPKKSKKKSKSGSDSGDGDDCDQDCLGCTRVEGISQMIPVIGGASTSSTDWFVKTFGLGSSECASVEVWWSSNRKTNSFVTSAKKYVTYPQLDCDVKSSTLNGGQFRKCVRRELRRLKGAGFKLNNKLIQKGMEEGYARYHGGAPFGSVVSAGNVASGTAKGGENVLVGVFAGLMVAACLCSAIVCLRRRCEVREKVDSDKNVNHLSRGFEVELEESQNESPSGGNDV